MAGKTKFRPGKWFSQQFDVLYLLIMDIVACRTFDPRIEKFEATANLGSRRITVVPVAVCACLHCYSSVTLRLVYPA
jgi:hypothetical protein